jgi:hypothetical protein
MPSQESGAHLDAALTFLAGTPTSNSTHFCSATTHTCYLLNTTTASYASHKAACTAKGGWLAAFSTGAEQLEVETAMSPQGFYWIGVEAGTEDRWMLADGSGSVGNGLPSNANPHAHWCVGCTPLHSD